MKLTLFLQRDIAPIRSIIGGAAYLFREVTAHIVEDPLIGAAGLLVMLRKRMIGVNATASTLRLPVAITVALPRLRMNHLARVGLMTP